MPSRRESVPTSKLRARGNCVALERPDIEVTEVNLMTDPIRASSALTTLIRLGVQVSIDDLGVGETSLGYLSKHAISELKIDRSFVRDTFENWSHRAIVQSIIASHGTSASTLLARALRTWSY